MVEKIKELCKKKNISVAKLEKEAGLGNGTIGKWEKFHRKPKYESLKSIAEVLGVPISDITGEEQKEKPPTHGGEPLHTMEDWERAIDGMTQEERKTVMELLMKKFMEDGK